MAPPSGAASYKKKDGTLTLTEDEQSLTWNPATTGASKLTIPVSNITSTQLLLALRHPVIIANRLRWLRFAADSGYECEGDAEDLRFGSECPAE